MTRNFPNLRIDFAPAEAAAASDLGNLPGWNLADLYPSQTSPEFQADMKKARSEIARAKAAPSGCAV